MTTMARGRRVLGEALWDGFTYLVMNGGREKKTMRMRINGCLVNLRALSGEQLDRLVQDNQSRKDRAREEYESLRGEQIRREYEAGQVAQA